MPPVAGLELIIDKRSKEGRVSPYSCRNRYALEGTLRYGLELRTIASYMGHSVTVHLRNYGRVIDDARQVQEGIDAYERVHGKLPMPLHSTALP